MRRMRFVLLFVLIFTLVFAFVYVRSYLGVGIHFALALDLAFAFPSVFHHWCPLVAYVAVMWHHTMGIYFER